ncbi:MAG TPA: dephospho-CoA kinase [Desulfobulbaceae bacterium]|nr:dephospho-CoA kinase [Desulfobulbaceae bacterium]
MIIGITGGIGSGKSRVANYWSRVFDLSLINLDTICRQLLTKGQPGWLALKKQFGSRFFQLGNHLDRPAFRQALFCEESLRNTVDNLLHPLAKSCMKKELQRYADTVVLVEIPLLFEAGWQQEVDKIVVVFADRETRCARLMVRDGVTRKEAYQALRIQLFFEEKIMAADNVVDNSGFWSDTCLQILHLGRLYI